MTPFARPLATGLLAATLALGLTACAPSIGDSKRDALATVETYTHLSDSERSEYRTRIEAAPDADTVEIIMDEAEALESERATTEQTVNGALEPFVTGQRWTFSPAASDAKLPDGDKCVVVFNADGTLGQDTTLFSKDNSCMKSYGATTGWRLSLTEPGTIEFLSPNGDQVDAWRKIDTSVPGTASTRIGAYGDRAVFTVAPANG